MKIVFRFLIGGVLFCVGVFFVANSVASSGFTVLEYPYTTSDIQEDDQTPLSQRKIKVLELVSRDNYLGIVAVRFQAQDGDSDDELIFRIQEQGQEGWYWEHIYAVDQFKNDELFPFGFPPLPDSKGKRYQVQLEWMQGMSEDAGALSAVEPVLVTKHKFDLHTLLADRNLLRYFFTAKALQEYRNPQFVPIVIVSLVPLAVYVFFLFFVSRRKNSVYVARNVRKIVGKIDDFFLLYKNSKFPELDGIRAWAICMVVMAHVRPWLSSIASEHTGSTRIVTNGILAVLFNMPFIGAKGGGTGVDLFFVLSGFLIVMTIHKNSPSFFRFIQKRYSRLLPVHFILILGSLPTLSIITIVLNIFFLVDFFPLVRNLSLLTWTLSYEILFYVICAVWFILWKEKKFLHTWKFFFAFVIALYGSQWMFGEFLAAFHIKYPDMNRFIAFFFGVALAKLYFLDPRRWNTLKRFFYHAALPGLCIIVLFRYTYEQVVAEKIFGELWMNIDFLFLDVGIFLLVGSMLVAGDHWAKRFFRMKALRIIGIISFSMYLSHYHLALPMARNMVNGLYVIPIKMIAFVILSFLISICFSIVLFHFLEKPYFMHNAKQKKTT